MLGHRMVEPSADYSAEPMPQLWGTYDGSSFRCRPRTHSTVAIEAVVVPRNDGGSDVVVQVRQWLLLALIVTLGTCLRLTADRSGFGAWLLVCGSGVAAHLAEGYSIRRRFRRILDVPARSANHALQPPAGSANLAVESRHYEAAGGS